MFKSGCAWLVFAFITIQQAHAAPPVEPIDMLVISGGTLASGPYAHFDYFARHINARMVFWHGHAREWHVYHHMDSIQPSDWKKAHVPLNKDAHARLMKLLEQDWDLVCWTGTDIAQPAREALLAKVMEGQPLIRFGTPEKDGVEDDFAELFESCDEADAGMFGGTTSQGPGKEMPRLKESLPPAAVLVYPRGLPEEGSARLPYDSAELRMALWNEVVAYLCNRDLLPPIFARVPTNAVWGAPISVSLAAAKARPKGEVIVTARAGRTGFATTWSGTLAAGGKIEIPTRSLPVGEWARVELTAEGFRPAVHWVALKAPVELTIAHERWGGGVGETIPLLVKANTLPDDLAAPLRIRIIAADRLGDVFWEQQEPVTRDAAEHAFTFTIPDLGVDRYAYYVTAWLVAGEDAVGRAATTLYEYTPWDMRREWQWSIWDKIYAHPPYRAAPGMNLIADAGFNSIGFGYCTARSVWWAERYGWRQYAEMQGGHKLWNAPVVKWADDDVLRKGVVGQINHMFGYFGKGWRSAALTLASLGEEPGYDKGWGRTYYWKTDTAPPVAQQVFQQFLMERYTTLDDLTDSWQTPMQDWKEATLDKTYALQGPKFDPLTVPEEAPDEAHDFARYQDSRDFFTWYFGKVAALATTRIHEINPGARTFYSLHGPDIVTEIGEAASHHIYYPKEFQAAAASRERSRRNGMPSFSLIWNHFGIAPVQTAGHWSQVANQVTHTDFWLGFPLVFNDDLTHTHASIASKRFLTRFQPCAQLLAEATVVESGAALLDGLFLKRNMKPMQSAYGALAEAGLPPAFVDESSLERARMIVASRATFVGEDLAAGLRRYVEDGGVLVTSAGFATRAKHGRLQTEAPGFELDKLLGLRYGTWLKAGAALAVSGGGPFKTTPDSGPLAGIEMPIGPYASELLDIAADAEVLARYTNDTAALLYRRVGKGAVYHLNAHYREWGWSRLYIPAREALRRIVGGIAARENIQPRYFLECRSPAYPEGTSMPFWGSQLFLGKDGKTHYLVVFNDHRNTLMTGRVHWCSPGWSIGDLMGAVDLAWTGEDDTGSYLDLPLLPGQGKVLRLTPAGMSPSSYPGRAGGPALPGPEGRGRAGPLNRLLAQASDAAARPAVARDETTVDAGSSSQRNPPVIPRGWPSEQWPRQAVSAEEFIKALAALKDIYATGVTRRDLSNYLFVGDVRNRHALNRQLAMQDWPAYVQTMAAALREGARFVLTGEDMGLDPATGLAVTTESPGILAAIDALGRTEGASWRAATDDGQVLCLTLGEGMLLLDRTSFDSMGFYERELKAWHHAWWPRIDALLSGQSGVDSRPALDAVTENSLASWLAGRGGLNTGPRTITQFSRGKSGVGFTNYELPVVGGNIALLALPQNAVVTAAQFAVRVASYPGFSNNGFEVAKGSGSAPAGMRGIYEGRGALDDTVKHSGERSLRLHPRVGGSRSVKLIAPLSLGRGGENIRGMEYKLSFWLKAKNLGRMEVKIRSMEWGKSITWDNDIWIPVGKVRGGTYDWEKVDLSCVLPDTRANYMNLHFVAFGDQATTVWLDDVRGGSVPTNVVLSIGAERGVGMPLPSGTDGASTVISEGLADRINAYLPRAPIDGNGMCVVPLHVSMKGSGQVTLANPKIVLMP